MSPISFCGFLFFMNRRPPRSTRTDTLFPYTTLFRSHMEAANRYLDIIDNNIDVAIRTREYEPDSNITIRRLCETRRILAASPGYLARNGIPRSLDDLQKHKLLIYVHANNPNELRFTRGEEHSIEIGRASCRERVCQYV